jgi:hypothetical protein
MYTTAQISDYFGSKGPYGSPNGNSTIGGNSLPEEVSYLQSILPALQTTIDNYDIRNQRDDSQFTTNIKQYIRDVTFPQVMRSVAGLMYWFAKETGMIGPLMFRANYGAPTINLIYNGSSFQLQSGNSIVLPANTTITVSAPAVTSNGTYTLYFKNWNKLEVDQSISESSTSLSWTTTIPSQGAFEVVYNREFNVNLSAPTFVEIGSGGTYKINGTNVGTTGLTTYIENTSQPIQIEAVPPSSDYCFVKWSDGDTINSRSFTPTDHTTLHAVFKKHLGSTISSATASNNQRKIAYCNGVSYMVYESGGEIWLTSSTNDGLSWSNETCLSDGTGLNRQPSIVGGSELGGSNIVDIAVVWERFEYYPQLGVGDVTIKMRLCNRSPRYWGAPITIAYEIVPQNYSGSTPVVALSGGYVAVAFTANDDPEFMGDIGGTGVFFRNYLTTANPSVVQACSNFLRIAGEGSAVPSLASKSTDLYNFGIAWKDGPCIYYQTFSTYNQSFTPVELVEERLVVGGPSLTDANVSQYDNPMIAWHTWDYIGGPCYLIACKQRGDNGWDTPTIMYGGQNSNYRDPSVAHARNTQTPAALVWHDNSNIYQAKYTTAWQPAEYKSAGVYPTLREEYYAASGAYCLGYMWGSQTPWIVSTTNEGFIGGGHHGEEKIVADKNFPLHRLDFVYNNQRHTLVLNTTVGSAEHKNHVGFRADRKSLKDVSFSEPIRVTSGMNLFLDVEYGTMIVDVKKDSVFIPMPLNLELFDTETNIRLFTLPLESQDKEHPSKSYQSDLSQLAGKTVKISVSSPLWKNDSVKISEAIFFLDGNYDSLRNARGKGMQKIELEIPKEYNLSQNYPNPFNPVTTIQYSLKSPSSVTLEIFDVLGRKVATLVNEQKPAGMHIVRWDASCASSGLYFYQINVVGVTGQMS